MALNTIEEIIQDIRLGKMVILMDDEDRENEGDIVMAAECVEAEHIAFMARYACGLICLPMSRERSERLKLPLMVERNKSGFGTKFTVSIEAAHGVDTGISAADRALTVRTAVARNAKADDIVQPGHIFPLIAEPGGVLVRAGHTEAACDLSRLAGFDASGVICEIMNPDGTMARRPELEKFAEEHGIKIGTIADLIHYRVHNESSIEKVSEGTINTDHGEFTLHTYRDTCHGDVHLAVTKGQLEPGTEPLVRVQFTSTLRDIICTQPSDSIGWNTQRCLQKIQEEGGVLLILGGQEHPDDLLASVDIALGKRETPAPAAVGGRSTQLTIGLGSQILRDLGVRQFRLLGRQVKYNALSGFDLEVTGYVDP
ncbi:bifunctional 3,4-dihydroxy-2-butanone-4-phosphate synthase/GTP cyclohydrolase II [Pseudomaricurvus sp. HS19]|uniref:bifunctional 3,4-dihydroxy-2-butanone-4-phosphate synthase/GTP cyclohydrolase II n=1 Tax=Pseudomaricurvus sp. HS19 TaxID=2692626 RepID=UPI00136EB6EF|nr:bifunctional 3,4-dihydroxy-2-butanone-4-phosphate synthase/GTP cyclohydrolase II [Pseudomaricurvus sp. HS19]MYM63347.1 3,4-dihydroxy-2-butanone-4-phosphate synthase [Pseudomaricurvus sp. HS19]